MRAGTESEPSVEDGYLPPEPQTGGIEYKVRAQYHSIDPSVEKAKTKKQAATWGFSPPLFLVCLN
jgi:hypothetical protein